MAEVHEYGPEAGGHGAEDGRGHGEEAHVSNRTYVLIGVVLAILTAIEVMVFYVDALQPALVPILMVLMVAKFALVAMFYMHLKFDSPILTGILSWGLVVAVTIILALMALFGRFTGA